MYNLYGIFPPGCGKLWTLLGDRLPIIIVNLKILINILNMENTVSEFSRIRELGISFAPFHSMISENIGPPI